MGIFSAPLRPTKNIGPEPQQQIASFPVSRELDLSTIQLTPSRGANSASVSSWLPLAAKRNNPAFRISIDA
jgi:hypothetical protein